ERIGQGRENVKNYLKEHPEMLQEIETLLKKDLISNGMKVDEDGVITE
ncbi:MAG: DNA recombination/repair protein RecA, partial [Clostridiales bacterium]|nr:DNA recombination/repair protein RecA [Clostridiales bacterium]